MQSENLDIFDFDGTLIRVNSFREINKRLLVKLLAKFKLLSFLRLSIWYFIRKTGIISHMDFKIKAVAIFERSLSEDEKAGIVQGVVDQNLNQKVYEAMSQSDNCIISTSAPYAYVSRMKLSDEASVISSLEPGDAYPDLSNFGQGKIDNVRAYFDGQNISVRNTYTDSEDDRPLIDLSENAFIVKSGKILKIKENGKSVDPA